MKNTSPVALRPSARAIILNDQNQMLVFERRRQNRLFSKLHHYYSIPGGGIDPGETPEHAVVREMREEMLVDIVPQQLIIHQIDTTDQRENYYFLARIIAGTPTFNLESEEAMSKRFFRQSSYEIAWVDLDDPLLGHYKCYQQVAQLVKKWCEQGSFPAETVDMTV